MDNASFAPAPRLPEPIAGRRILVLVPHPDDEVVGCAAAIRRARAAGAEVFTLYLTTGVPSAAALWRWQRGRHAERVLRRRREARAAAVRLGVEPLTFTEWPSRDLKAHLAAARRLIAGHRVALRADAIWTPAYEGGHQDHDVTSFLASTFAPEARVVEMAEYNRVTGRRAPAFPSSTGAEQTIALSSAERAWKAELLAIYTSERPNLAPIFRRGFDREILRPLPPHDYRQPPHPGPLFYERFHWVPFRHPRVDFTRSADVSAAIARFREPARRSLRASGPRA